MAGVSFDEEPVVSAPVLTQSPALVRLVIRWGFAKDEKSAELFLLCIVIAGFITMFVLLFLQFGKGSGEYRTPDQIRMDRGFTAPIPSP
ncbi:MAG: hypothetical protein QG636_675 [Patescibacteria group bacterium]|nr:hypothetical protein [Patescibacteria group bacterium]